MFEIFLNKKVFLKVLVLKLDLRTGFFIPVERELRGNERNHRRLYCQLLPYLDQCGQKAPPSPDRLRQRKGGAICSGEGGEGGVRRVLSQPPACPVAVQVHSLSRKIQWSWPQIPGSKTAVTWTRLWRTLWRRKRLMGRILFEGLQYFYKRKKMWKFVLDMERKAQMRDIPKGNP